MRSNPIAQMPNRLLLAVLMAATFANAQAPPATESTPAAKDVRETPRGALLGYLDACRDENYRRASSFLNFRREQRGQGSPEEVARKLKQIVDRKLSHDPNSVSNAPEGDLNDGLESNLESFGTIRLADRNFDLLLERVQRPEVGPIWLVSSNTISLIPILYEDISTNTIEQRLPAWMIRLKFLDTALWQWLALLLLTLVALLLGHGLARAVVRSLRPLARRTHSSLDDVLVESMRTPLQLLIALAAYRVGIVWIAPSYLLRTYLSRILTGIIYLCFAWVFVRLIDAITTKLMVAMTGRQKSSVASIMPLTRRTLKAIVVGIAILATLGSWGYDTTALLAGLGVGGLAVAFAAQKTLENLFGGVAVTTDKPVLVGDFCRYGDKLGTVEDIGLRSTRIRTLDRTVVTVPNGEFSSLQIENFGKRDKMSFRPILQLRRDTTAQQLRAVLPRIRQMLLDRPDIERTPRVRLLAIAPNSLDVEIFSYILTADYDEFLLKQEDLILKLLEILSQEGVSLSVPAQLNILTRQTKPSNHPISGRSQTGGA
jgi:MscS family membrane protein